MDKMYKIVHQATCKFLGINEGYKLVMDEMYEIGRFIEKFEYEYSKICVISTKLQTLIISNRKITPNCCLPASFHEVLVNYASNMIRIRLNNCTIFWKQGFYRSSHRRCSVKKGVLRKMFSEFTGKHLCHRLYFNKVAGLRL